MPVAAVNGISIYYEVHGDRGSPVAAIAGFGAAIDDWLPELVEEFSASHRVLLFDNRGIGRSGGVPSPFTMAQYAADTIGLLDVLGFERANILGYSMGGMIAQYVALDYPDRVSSLILAATGPGGPGHPKVFPPSAEVFAQLAKPPSDDRAQDIRDGWWIGYTQTFIEERRGQLERNLARKLSSPVPDPSALEGQVAAMSLTHDTYDRLSEIDCPTLIQTGLEDILVPPQNSRLIAELVPGALLKEYVGCAHGFYEESDGRAADDVLTFLQQVEGGASR